MNETNKVDMNASNKNNQPETVRPSDMVRRRPQRMRWWMPTLAAIGLGVVVVTGVKSASHLGRAGQVPPETTRGSSSLADVKAHVPVVSEAERAREAARIREARKAAAEAFRVSVEAEYEAFKRRVSERAAAFDVVRGGIPGTVDKYGFRKCWAVMWALAKDKVAEKIGKGSMTNFDHLMNADLREGFYQPLQDARGEVLVLLNEFQTRLQVCRDELDRSMVGIPDWDRSLGEPPMSLKADSLRIEEAMAALRAVQIGATVSAAFDAVCLAGVYQAVKSLLLHAAGRLAGGMATGAVTSQLDGPIPGPADLVAMGICAVSVAATAWEVRKAAKEIPEQLRKIMNETVDTQCAEVRRRTLDEGEKLYLSYVRKARLVFTGGD